MHVLCSIHFQVNVLPETQNNTQRFAQRANNVIINEHAVYSHIPLSDEQ